MAEKRYNPVSFSGNTAAGKKEKKINYKTCGNIATQ